MLRVLQESRIVELRARLTERQRQRQRRVNVAITLAT